VDSIQLGLTFPNMGLNLTWSNVDSTQLDLMWVQLNSLWGEPSTWGGLG